MDTGAVVNFHIVEIIEEMIDEMIVIEEDQEVGTGKEDQEVGTGQEDQGAVTEEVAEDQGVKIAQVVIGNEIILMIVVLMRHLKLKTKRKKIK
jgi:hypothetical protein